jgi:hypothetical protein
MKFVREASQRRSASHTHKHDPDTHRFQLEKSASVCYRQEKAGESSRIAPERLPVPDAHK